MARENEPPQIPQGGENVFSWDRGEIEAAFKHLDTTDAQDQAQKYGSAATLWDQGLETFKRSIHGSIAEAWEGASADAAKLAINQYTDDAANLTDLFAGISNDIKTAGTQIVEMKNSIPEANHHSWTANIWPPRAAEEQRTIAKADGDARDAMLRKYVQPFAGLDGNVPVVPAAMNPLKPGDPTGGIPTGGIPTVPGVPTGPGGPGTTPGNPGNTPGTPNQDQPGGQQHPDGQQPGTQTTPTSAPVSTTATNPSGPTGTTPGTVPSSVTPGTPTMPSGTFPAGTYPGGPGSPDIPGTEPGGPGRSVPGMPGTSRPGQNPAAALGGRPGTAGLAGMSGMGGMGAPGRGKGDEENEREHKTPDYLITEENTRELIGDLPRTIPGGVIGGDRQDDDGARPR
jgi:hypothetical protein